MHPLFMGALDYANNKFPSAAADWGQLHAYILFSSLIIIVGIEYYQQ